MKMKVCSVIKRSHPSQDQLLFLFALFPLINSYCSFLSHRIPLCHIDVSAFFFPASRGILLPMLTMQLKPHLEIETEMKVCVDIISDLLITLKRTDVVSSKTFPSMICIIFDMRGSVILSYILVYVTSFKVNGLLS